IIHFGPPVPRSVVHYHANDGARPITATDTSLQFQFITITGTVIDTYTIGTPPNLPTVTIAPTDPFAAEAGLDPGTFTVTRTGSTMASLAVNYTIGGTATNGTDYTTLPTSVTIPADSATATIQVMPLAVVVN